jgi:hypothetical protein
LASAGFMSNHGIFLENIEKSIEFLMDIAYTYTVPESRREDTV